MSTSETAKHILIFTSVFPNAGRPLLGIFVRERMFRIAEHYRITVVAPMPWFPGQGLIRKYYPHFRLPAPKQETQLGVTVYHPRFFSIPGFCKSLDGWFMALSCFRLMRRLKASHPYQLIDAHFAYPDGFAATLLGRWLKTPVTITLRGSEQSIYAPSRLIKCLMLHAIHRAVRVFSVSNALRNFMIRLGAPANKLFVIGNGVDTNIFFPVDRAVCRKNLGLADDVEVLVTVAGRIKSKGIHRVIACMPALKQRHPNLHYLIVGGAAPHQDYTVELQKQIRALGLESCVHLLGTREAAQLKYVLSAADVSVLASDHEGWANVLLEAMACGLPVVATHVGGNAEVINDQRLGHLVPLDDASALLAALDNALRHPWDRVFIRQYAEENHWDKRISLLLQHFKELM